MELVQIEIAHTPFKTLEDTPKDLSQITEECVIEIFPKYFKCIKGLENNKHIFVLCWLHKSKKDVFEVHIRKDLTKPLTGVFNSRSPERPNPISLTRAEMVRVEENKLIVKHLDILDGTPVIDIKPFLAGYDSD